MLGERDSRVSLSNATAQYLEFVGADGFYGFLAQHGHKLFRDEDFAELYCLDNGRRSVPPSILAIALLLQTHDRVSDEEAKQRADYDLRWKVALGVETEARPFAKSTLQLFRAQLVIHEKARQILARSLSYAKQLGYGPKGRKVRLALDTSHILGRGAVEDTYNLIAEGIRTLARTLAGVEGVPCEQWLEGHCFERYLAPSIKGSEAVDWDDEGSRRAFLTGLIADGQRLLELASDVRSQLEPGGEPDGAIVEASELLRVLLWQDVEPTEGGYRIRQGTAQDRIPSVHDPDARHGHKSQGKNFTGHKGAIAVELETQLITAVAVLPGNAADAQCALELVEASEEAMGVEAEAVIGDTAFGSVEVREQLGEREVIAPTPKGGNATNRITKADFEIDLERELVRCPMGQETWQWCWVWMSCGKGKPKKRTKRFAFSKAVCRACARFSECVKDKRRRGRFVTLHPNEAALQAARAAERTERFRAQYRQRVVAEHRLGRLMGLGMRQARYCGHPKTLLQLVLGASVANLTLVAGKLGLMWRKGCSEEALMLCGLLREASRRLKMALWRLVRGSSRLQRQFLRPSADSAPRPCCSPTTPG